MGLEHLFESWEQEAVRQLGRTASVGAGWVVAADYASVTRRSVGQARHVLNTLAEKGLVEKVSLSEVGIDPAEAGARYGYRRSDKGDR